MPKHEVEVGNLVALNTLPDAVWFEVIRRDGFTLYLVEDGLANAATQYVDVSLVAQVKIKKPEPVRTAEAIRATLLAEAHLLNEGNPGAGNKLLHFVNTATGVELLRLRELIVSAK